MYTKTCASGLALLLVCASALADATVVTRADQQKLIAAATRQRNTALAAYKALQSGASQSEVEAPLLAAVSEWNALQYSDLIKSAFGACSALVGDTHGLAVSVHANDNSATFQAQKKRYIAEDRAMCDEALANPNRALKEQTADYDVKVE